ncbi:SDR family oxidoreductase [Fibrella sp. HMF5335]|uniref:SDR family oxidoreductase n=1 Tax=Fibrella rubiginis TaxID=2817060 RepID=A0A939GFQ6_9BACT|nr:SDR family oxidoreductase [Fibrella rubiginis]MBO0936958.1 SDR family oxidoreductase [Fibrella rubiginis]
MRFKDKVCIVTGGTSGIGRATAVRLGAEGGKVLIVGRDEEEANEVIADINSKGSEARFAKTDIENPDEIKAAVDQALAAWGRIDVLINDAAMMTFTPIVDLAMADWEQVINVNLRSIFLFCKFCIPHLNGGAIVNVSSVHAHQSTPNVIPYATSKGGLEAFTRGVSLEYPIDKLRINCVAPGAVDTPMLWDNPNVKNGKEKVEGVIGKPEDIAAAICFLAADEARFVNGTTLVVDGGRLAML